MGRPLCALPHTLEQFSGLFGCFLLGRPAVDLGGLSVPAFALVSDGLLTGSAAVGGLVWVQGHG